jgi:hypothetical protein
MTCRSVLWSITALLVTLTAFPAYRQRCSESERTRMEAQSDRLRSWDALYRSFVRYKACLDDADAQEGYSESKARILADHWETLPRLAALIRNDAAFGRWVMLDATMNTDDVEKIRSNAIQHCPRGLKSLCARLVKQADDAIAENASVQR